jgi:hypothetical protein
VAIARHHAEWLSLVETSGPFLSMPVLARVFPQGLDAHDAGHARTLRLARDEWETSQEGSHPETALHAAWIRFVLTETLELPGDRLVEGQAIPPSLHTSVPEHGQTLSPDIALLDPGNGTGAGKPRLLVQVYPPAQDLKRSVSSARWKVSPETRMVELLRGTDTRLGLATNGEQWMLVSVRPGEPAGRHSGTNPAKRRSARSSTALQQRRDHYLFLDPRLTGADRLPRLPHELRTLLARGRRSTYEPDPT